MKIVVTGVTGQDGSTMIDYLLDTQPEAKIYGVIRQLSVPNHKNIAHLTKHPRVKFIDGDISDPHSMSGIIRDIQPDYFINFAANSFVKTSWGNPIQVFETNTLSVAHQLEAIRNFSPHTRYYQAGSSEEFGDVSYCPQDEKHPLRPRSPYGASKAAARHLVKVYRESYGIYAVAGWLFNHEGVRRGEQFVTRKITKGVSRIRQALSYGQSFEPIVLGNLEAKRDWSDAEDFVDGVWKMLNQESPKDYVLASGETHSIREFIELALKAADIEFTDNNPDCIAPIFSDTSSFQVNYSTWVGIPLIVVSSEFYRPAEVDILLGDASAAKKELGWNPKTSFTDLVNKMVAHDLELINE